MKVLHLTTWREPCGIAGYAEDLVNALNGQGVSNEVFPLDKRNHKNITNGELRRRLETFCEVARDYDLIHVQHEFSFFTVGCPHWLQQSIENFAYLLEMLDALKKPVVVTCHTGLDFDPQWRKKTTPHSSLAMKIAAGLVYRIRRYRKDRVSNLRLRQWQTTVAKFFHDESRHFQAIAHTRATRVELTDHGFSANKIEVMPLGITPRCTQALGLDQAAAKERLGYPADAVVLSMFGFVVESKGYNVAIKALQELPSRFHLAIIGGPHPGAHTDLTVNRILGLAKRLGLQDRIRITGYASQDTIDLYHAATDACLAPYKYHRQSGSASINWALSSRKPVIASKIATLIEINEQCSGMLLFTEGATHELAWQIQQLMSQPELQQTLVENASRYVAANTCDHVARRLSSLYGRLLDDAGDHRQSVSIESSPKSASSPASEAA